MTITKEWEQEAWEQIVRKVSRTSKRIKDRFPHASVNGEYVLEPPYWWTAGFWPGLLWLVYRDTK
ncbi:MAG TPA: glycosyl hydrolase, partial [Candidatus Paenibacillus intestinavium]|nr:glycosyl hydrolase [Candidatus Paenibacillus intestinavium]